MMHLAIQTDSTRFITLADPGRNLVPAITGVDTDHHMLSHNAKDPEKIAQLAIVETAIVAALGRFLGKLADASEAERFTIGPNHGFVRIQSWQRQQPRQQEYADSVGGRWIPSWAALGV